MAFTLNRLELIGRLGHDPEMRYSQEGQAVTRFSVATDRPVRPGGLAETDWHQVVCFGKTAEFAGTYLAKGRLVYLAGRVVYRTWESSDGVRRGSVEVVANDLIALDRRPEQAPEPEGFAEEDVQPSEKSEPARGREPVQPASTPAASAERPAPRPAPQSHPSSGQGTRRPPF